MRRTPIAALAVLSLHFAGCATSGGNPAPATPKSRIAPMAETAPKPLEPIAPLGGERFVCRDAAEAMTFSTPVQTIPSRADLGRTFVAPTQMGTDEFWTKISDRIDAGDACDVVPPAAPRARPAP